MAGVPGRRSFHSYSQTGTAAGITCRRPDLQRGILSPVGSASGSHDDRRRGSAVRRMDALVVTRYDRLVSATGVVRRHQKDCAQMLGLNTDDPTRKFQYGKALPSLGRIAEVLHRERAPMIPLLDDAEHRPGNTDAQAGHRRDHRGGSGRRGGVVGTTPCCGSARPRIGSRTDAGLSRIPARPSLLSASGSVGPGDRDGAAASSEAAPGLAPG